MVTIIFFLNLYYDGHKLMVSSKFFVLLTDSCCFAVRRYFTKWAGSDGYLLILATYNSEETIRKQPFQHNFYILMPSLKSPY